jgi:hypothetical protein
MNKRSSIVARLLSGAKSALTLGDDDGLTSFFELTEYNEQIEDQDGAKTDPRTGSSWCIVHLSRLCAQTS